jgi:2-dehydropantoate 2-reductase
MEQIESVLIAGAGAIGLLAADTLYRYNPSRLRLLASGERLRRYREQGITVNGVKVDFSFADPEHWQGINGNPYFDLIIVSSKFHHLNEIIPELKSFVGPETIILSLLNGISSEEILGASYGRSRLPLAMIIGTDSQHVEGGASFSTRGIINFGDSEGRDTERDRLIAAFFTRAALPFDYRKKDMKRTFWYKYMINVGINQSSALLRLPYASFKRNHSRGIGEARELMESAMREVIAVAKAQDIDLGEGDIDAWYQTLAALNDSGYTSMCQDVLAGRKTEVELFGLTMAEYGRRLGIPTPVNETLYRALRAVEQGYGIKG